SVRADGQQIRQVADHRKAGLGEQLDRRATAELLQIEFDELRRARQVEDAQQHLFAAASQKDEDPRVVRQQELEVAPSKTFIALPQVQHSAKPPQQRMRALLFGLDVARQ